MSGVKMHTTTIAGAKWSLNNLPADKGLDGIRLLAVVLGEPAAAAGGLIGSALKDLKANGKTDAEIAQAPQNLLDLDIEDATLGQVLSAICGGMSKPEVKELIQLMLEGLVKNGAHVDFNEEFASNYLTLAKVVGWALKVNFADFFGAAPGLAGGLLGKKKEPE